MVVIHEALKQGRLQGFISDTVITLEGIGTDDRAIVFGSTSPRSSMAQTSDDTFTITIRTEQPDRKPFHPKQAERVVAAFQLGIRLLGAPRAGMPQVTEKQFYTTEDPAMVGERLDRFVSTLRQIESRGLGSARAERIAARFAPPGAFPGPWFKALGEAKDIHAKREVARAVAEWADADSVAAHYAYGNTSFALWMLPRPKPKEGTRPSLTRITALGSPKNLESSL